MSDSKTTQYWLTTTDNPFDPFIQFREWYSYDEAKGYHTCSYLDRQAKTASTLDGEMNEELINQAIDDIIEFDLYGKYKKVSRS